MPATLTNAARKSGGRRLILIATASAVSLGLLALGGKAITSRPDRGVDGSSRNSAAIAGPASLVAASAGLTAQNAKLVVVRVTAFPYGFEPAEITRPAGPFLLVTENHAGTDDLSFRLETDQKSLVHSAAIPRGRSRFTKEMLLAPGKYVLTEASHTNWSCTITITGQ